MNINDLVRTRLERLGLSPRAASLKAGLNSHFVQNLLSGKVQSVKTESLVKLADALETTPEYLIEGKHEGLDLLPFRGIIVRGSVQAGQWTEASDEAFEADPDSIEIAPVSPPPGYERANLFALRVKGRSMDLVYPEGTIVIVCPVSDTDIRDGDNVIVIRRRNGFTEATVKQVETDGKKWTLHAKSSDKSFSKPWVIEDNGDDSPEIVAVVIGSYRHEARPPAVYQKKR